MLPRLNDLMLCVVKSSVDKNEGTQVEEEKSAEEPKAELIMEDGVDTPEESKGYEGIQDAEVTKEDDVKDKK